MDIPLQSILLTSQEHGWWADPFLSKTGSNHNTSHERGHPLTDVCLSLHPAFSVAPSSVAPSVSPDQVSPGGHGNLFLPWLAPPSLVGPENNTEGKNTSILEKNVFSGNRVEVDITPPKKVCMVLQRSWRVSRTQGPHRLNKLERRKSEDNSKCGLKNRKAPHAPRKFSHKRLRIFSVLNACCQMLGSSLQREKANLFLAFLLSLLSSCTPETGTFLNSSSCGWKEGKPRNSRP